MIKINIHSVIFVANLIYNSYDVFTILTCFCSQSLDSILMSFLFGTKRVERELELSIVCLQSRDFPPKWRATEQLVHSTRSFSNKEINLKVHIYRET